MMILTNGFRFFRDLGYQELIPVVPPGAQIHPKSSLFPKVGTKDDARGKAPGVKGYDGLWRSYDWRTGWADDAELGRWAAMGASVGLRMGPTLMVDVDILDPDLAARAIAIFRDHFGSAVPSRVGRAPKAAFLLRAADPDAASPYCRIEVPGDTQTRIEVLSHGRQGVVWGVHPKTMQPYAWTPDPLPFADLPVATDEQIAAYLEDSRSLGMSRTVRSVLEAKITQAALKGDPAFVRKIVEATPNDQRVADSRDAWIAYGYAIKAATQDDPALGLALWLDWCDRWVHGENDEDAARAEWGKMRPPYRVGIQKLCQLLEDAAETDAEKQQASALVVSRFLEPIPDTEPSIFDIAAERERREERQSDVYPLVSVTELWDRPAPVFLIERHIPAFGLAFVFARPGAGKTFLTLDMALAVACGLETWHGDRITIPATAGSLEPDGRGALVIYIAAEGAFDLGVRVRAWCVAHGITEPPKNLLVIEQTIDFMRTDDQDKLLRTIRSVGGSGTGDGPGDGPNPALVFVDTISRAMPGADENLQRDMTIFVKACDRVREAFKCNVIGVHHASRQGDIRGSTVLPGAGDAIFELERDEGEEIGFLVCRKLKAGEDGWQDRYRFGRVACDKGVSLVPERLARAESGVTTAPAGEMSAVLAAMASAWDSGEPWGSAARAGERWAPRIMKRLFGGLFKDVADAERTLETWERAGVVAVETANRKTKKRGYRVVAETGSQDKMSSVSGEDGDIFAL